MTTIRQVQRQQTTQKVILAASDLFAKQGFEDTTIRDIAVACDVSVGTVISVGDKNALLIQSFDQRINNIHQKRQPVDKASPKSLADQVTQVFDPFIELFTNDPALVRSYAAVLVSGRHSSIVFTELSSILIEEIVETIQNSAATTKMDRPSIAESIYFAYIGRIFTWSSDKDVDPSALRNSLHTIITSIFDDKEF